jgi:hypothetical protein
MRRLVTSLLIMIAGIGGLNLIGLARADSVVAPARQFSAELVNSDAAGEVVGTPGKVYVDGLKVRIETPDFPDSFLLIDGSVPGAYLVRPQSRVFMDAKQSSRLTRLFVPLAGDDPCPQWQTMAEVAGIPDQSGRWHCEEAEHETVAGRATVKFNATSPRGRAAGWIDSDLKFPLKIETEDGAVFTLRNIQQGPQAADLFVIPANYKKFDPRLLIERYKHSDVFVEPPGQGSN